MNIRPGRFVNWPGHNNAWPYAESSYLLPDPRRLLRQRSARSGQKQVPVSDILVIEVMCLEPGVLHQHLLQIGCQGHLSLLIALAVN